nr:hypothetical protein [Tanacetum cinerariifolium]
MSWNDADTEDADIRPVNDQAPRTEKQMAPRQTTRSIADHETVNATMVTNAQLQAMIDQGVTATLAARDALRSMNGDDSHNSGTGIEGVASLSQWCERMEYVFHISNCATENQVKFATCTLHSVALTWWNTHVQTELEVKGTDLASYTQRFQELALLCGRMFSEEADKIKKYVGGLPDMIHGSVVASKPKTMQEAIEISTELMDKKIRTFAERETVSKREFENTLRNTQNQQQQHSNKRQNTSRVYTATSGGKKQYGGSRPLCAKCDYHHDGPCAPNATTATKLAILNTPRIQYSAVKQYGGVTDWYQEPSLYTSRLLDAVCKKALNILKKGLLVLEEAKTTSKWRLSRQTTNC